MNTSMNNGRLAVQMEDARYCLADLAQRGLSILSIKIGSMRSKPIIVLDAPYITPGGLEGGRMRFSVRSGLRTETYATQHCGCQVEWEVPA